MAVDEPSTFVDSCAWRNEDDDEEEEESSFEPLIAGGGKCEFEVATIG